MRALRGKKRTAVRENVAPREKKGQRRDPCGEKEEKSPAAISEKESRLHVNKEKAKHGGLSNRKEGDRSGPEKKKTACILSKVEGHRPS